MSSWRLRVQNNNLGIHCICSNQKRSGVSGIGLNNSLSGSHRSLLVSQKMMGMHRSIANYFSPCLPKQRQGNLLFVAEKHIFDTYTLFDFWISHLEKTSE